MKMKREIILVSLAAVLVALVFAKMGMAFGLRMMVEISCFTIIALGLTIQWGYAGLFNAGIMGFIALSGFTSMLVSYPVNEKFWQSGYASDLASVFAWLFVGIAVIWGISKLPMLLERQKLRRLLLLITIAVTYLSFMQNLAPVASGIEKSISVRHPCLPGWRQAPQKGRNLSFFRFRYFVLRTSVTNIRSFSPI